MDGKLAVGLGQSFVLYKGPGHGVAYDHSARTVSIYLHPESLVVDLVIVNQLIADAKASIVAFITNSEGIADNAVSSFGCGSG
jgi:hypothetical protein